MPRQARKKSSTDIYHVMLRGTNRQDIFFDDKDRRSFIKFVKEIKKESPFILYAYCLMRNHVHLLIRESETPIDIFMKRIGIKYAVYFNSRHNRCGHVFQDRFKSENVEDERYFLTVYRYILRNPVKAGICSEPGDYRWSSYGELFRPVTWIDNNFVLSMIGKKELAAFINMENEDRCMDNDNQRDAEYEKMRQIIKENCERIGFNNLSDNEQNELIRSLLKEGFSGANIRKELHITDYRMRSIRRQLEES